MNKKTIELTMIDCVIKGNLSFIPPSMKDKVRLPVFKKELFITPDLKIEYFTDCEEESIFSNFVPIREYITHSIIIKKIQNPITLVIPENVQIVVEAIEGSLQNIYAISPLIFDCFSRVNILNPFQKGKIHIENTVIIDSQDEQINQRPQFIVQNNETYLKTIDFRESKQELIVQIINGNFNASGELKQLSIVAKDSEINLEKIKKINKLLLDTENTKIKLYSDK